MSRPGSISILIPVVASDETNYYDWRPAPTGGGTRSCRVRARGMNAADRTFAPCRTGTISASPRVPAHTRPVPPPPSVSTVPDPSRADPKNTRAVCGRLRPVRAEVRGGLAPWPRTRRFATRVRLLRPQFTLWRRCGYVPRLFFIAWHSLSSATSILATFARSTLVAGADAPAAWTRWRPPSTAVYRW